MKRAIIFAVMVLLCVSFVLADMPGTKPHGFYGEVYYSDGVLILDDLEEVRAEIGEYENSCSLINGTYDLVVASDEGGIISFFVGGVNEPIETFIFEAWEITELNLMTDIPNPAPYCGDGSCNNGETCSTCSQDCGTCNDGGSSGGGGGGGGGGGSYTPSTIVNGTIALNNEEESEGIGEVIEEETTKTEEPISGTGLGAVIGFVKSIKGLGLAFGLAILVLGAVILVIQKRRAV